VTLTVDLSDKTVLRMLSEAERKKKKEGRAASKTAHP